MNDVNEERNSTSDIGRMAILVSELQRDVMEMGKHLGALMQRMQVIDQAVAQRLARIENVVIPREPVAAQAAVKGAGPKVVDLRSSQAEVKEEAKDSIE